MTSIFERIRRFVLRVFKTSLEVFLEALELSPNAQGYVLGSVSELLLKKNLEERGFELKRIKEKWEGKKHPRHHGDFYFRGPASPSWFVLESKGVKSNSEKWHKLYNPANLRRFLIAHADNINWIRRGEEIESQVREWINANLPEFQDKYASHLYEYEEIQEYLKNRPGRETGKARAMASLQDFTREQISGMIEERLAYLMSKLGVLETHFVSGVSGTSERTQATPRKDEFNIVAIDMVLRYPEHKFLFASPKHLEPSGDDPDHLQQNYIMGFVFSRADGPPTLSVAEEWYEDFMDVYQTLNPEDSIGEDDMQVDHRYVITDDPGQE